MKSIKKLLICSLSLVLISSVGLPSVKARHVQNKHYHITRIMKRHPRKHLRHSRKRHISHQNIELGSLYFDTDKVYHTIYNDLNFIDNTNIHVAKNRKTCIKDNSIIIPLIKRYWKSFTSVQQQKLIQLGQPSDASHADFHLYDKLSSQVNQSQYGLAQASDQHSEFLNQIRAELIQDINQTRIQHGLKPLRVTTYMQQTANHEVQWAQYAYEHLNDYLNYPHNTSDPRDNWVHGFATHNSASDFLWHRNYNIFPEDNSSTWYKGTGRQADGTPDPYNDNTPQGIADNVNSDFMNHDMAQGNNNGHREIELDPTMTYLGVGVTYNPTNNIGSVNEEYGNDVVFE